MKRSITNWRCTEPMTDFRCFHIKITIVNPIHYVHITSLISIPVQYVNINTATILQISMIPFVYAVSMPLKLPNTTFCTALTFAYIEMSYFITSIVMD